jgi:hypothetical protein
VDQGQAPSRRACSMAGPDGGRGRLDAGLLLLLPASGPQLQEREGDVRERLADLLRQLEGGSAGRGGAVRMTRRGPRTAAGLWARTWPMTR